MLSTRLLNSDGLASNYYDFAASQADSQPTQIESQAAAIFGLLKPIWRRAGQLSRSRHRGPRMLQARFHHTALATYRTTLGQDDTFTWTPERFASLQTALSRMYVLVAARPGGDSLRATIESRLARLNKLVLNGWDDANDNGQVSTIPPSA